MNEEQRIAYSQTNKRRMILFEREFTPAVYKLLRKEFKKQAALVKAGKRPVSGIVEGLSAELMLMYRTVGLFYAKKTRQQINRVAREVKAGFGIDQDWIDMILEYFRLYLLNKAVLPISQTSYDDILAIMSKGEQEGWSIDKMAFEIEHSDMPVWRARMIVRTELLKAQSYGKHAAAETSQWETNKQWIAADDHRTRHSHRVADGQSVRGEGKFHVGKKTGGYDMMDGPGDPTASAGNVINCRCTMSVTPARDERGRLIRKRKISVLLPEEVRRARREVVTI